MDVATVHLASNCPNDEVLPQARAVLARHGLTHATIQVDPDQAGKRCRDDMGW